MSADGRRLIPGIAAVALFVLLALVTMRSAFEAGAGFPADVSVTASIGYSMLGLAGGNIPAENFLPVFEIIDLVLVAALVGSVLLARRDGERVGPLEGGEQ